MAPQVSTNFWWGNLREGDHLEDQGVEIRIMLKWILKQHDAGVDWISLAQHKDRWRTLMNAVMDLRIP